MVGIPMAVVVSMPADLRENAHRGQEDGKSPLSRQRRHAVVVGQADRHADGEEQRQIGKIAPPDCGHDLRDVGSHEKFALPTPSRMPATGRTETGSIMHLPIFWR